MARYKDKRKEEQYIIKLYKMYRPNYNRNIMKLSDASLYVWNHCDGESFNCRPVCSLYR